MSRTNEDYLRWKFGRWVAKGYAPNVALLATGYASVAGILEPGEAAVALITVDSGRGPILLTDLRLVQGGRTLVRFEDVAVCIWIDRDKKSAAKRKAKDYNRVILEFRDGSELTIEGLGRAVFPLLNFFWNKLGLYERAE